LVQELRRKTEVGNGKSPSIMAIIRGRYYQLSRHRGGRRWTEYYGRNSWDIVAEHAALRRAREEAIREAREWDRRQRAALRVEDALGRLLSDLVTRELGRAGYSRLGRGPWRRRTAMKAIEQPPLTPEEREAAVTAIEAAVAGVQGGEKGAMARLRELGAQFPSAVIAATFGDTAAIARMALLHHFENHPATQEGSRLMLDRLAAELAGPDPSPSRRLCAEVAAYSHAEHWLIQATATEKGWSTPAGIRRQDAAHSRYMKALKTLAAITRLEKPRPRPIVATQVNIGVPPPPEPGAAALPDF
jgi:hypothetical protein